MNIKSTPFRAVGKKPNGKPEMNTQSRFGLTSLLVGLTIGLSLLNAQAFSLMGPYESWMTPSNGFHLPGDIGGPMNVTEEYRWNVPQVTYTFDSSFVGFFGPNGVAAVQGAIQILNDLPPASQMDPNAYPLDTRGTNATAQTGGLIDLKSETLFLLLQQSGLAQPQRFMFCVHDFSVAGGNSNALVVLRNFDPITQTVTNALNGTLFTSNLLWQVNNPPGVGVAAMAVPINPTDPSFTAVADGWTGNSPGWFYTGLTRDDAGGLRYLLQTNNCNLEFLLSDVHGNPTNSDNYVNQALRGGVDKIRFVQEPINAFTGEFIFPVTNQYSDTFVANGVWQQQPLERVTTNPDFIFSAYDGSGAVAVTVEMTGTTNWLNDGLPAAAGPGTIHPQVTIAFPKFGLQALAVTSDADGTIALRNEHWASFDASTNPPVIYPWQSAPGSGNPWTMNLSLLDTNYQSLPGGSFTWQLPVSLGAAVRLESSTNLIDWITLTAVTNHGIPLSWEHLYSRPSEFYRVVPQTNP